MKAATIKVLIVALTVVGCTSTGSPEVSTSPSTTAGPSVGPLATVGVESYGYRFDYPSNWQPDSQACGGLSDKATDPTTLSCFSAPPQDGLTTAAIVASVIALDKPTSLPVAWQEYGGGAIDFLGEHAAAVPGSEMKTVLCYPARTATYTLVWNGVAATARQTMVIDPAEEHVLVLTEIAATDVWDGLAATFDQVDKSFAWPTEFHDKCVD